VLATSVVLEEASSTYAHPTSAASLPRWKNSGEVRLLMILGNGAELEPIGSTSICRTSVRRQPLSSHVPANELM
jgi:hypothetical protein